ncbi:MAG: hypothetical protein CVV49_07510 [Spirochaetae bacterium HGW-Spirochaetae-5]|nr:MAG: hypothetical protein CVV49_07510 [Spirochaetae bacterium HGW-Spirochaetae-5]
MKKIVLILMGLAMCFQLIQCSSTKSAPAKQTTDPAVEACNTNCKTIYAKCMQAAGKNESKKKACTDNIVKCSVKCPEKAKDYKKPAPEKKSTYSEI